MKKSFVLLFCSLVFYSIIHASESSFKDRYPLHSAAHCGAVWQVRIMLEEPSRYNVNEEAEGTWTPLQYAASEGHHEVVQALCERGAKSNGEFNRTIPPFYLSVINGYPEVVRIFLDFGAEINKKGCCERAALHWAAEYDRYEVAQVLIANGARLSEKTDDLETTPLQIAKSGMSSRRTNEHEYLIYLMEHGNEFVCGLHATWCKSILAAYHPRCGAQSSIIIHGLSQKYITKIAEYFVPNSHQMINYYVALGKTILQRHQQQKQQFTTR